MIILLLSISTVGAQVKKPVKKAEKSISKETAKVFSATVIGIKDGDTFVVLTRKKQQITIRLAAVDCPEKKQNYGEKAKQFSSQEIFGKVVNVRIVSKDMYGRNIAFVTYANKNLSKELLKAGLAWHYQEYDGDKFLQYLENQARIGRKGLWFEFNPIKPSEFRKLKKIK